MGVPSDSRNFHKITVTIIIITKRFIGFNGFIARFIDVHFGVSILIKTFMFVINQHNNCFDFYYSSKDVTNMQRKHKSISVNWYSWFITKLAVPFTLSIYPIRKQNIYFIHRTHLLCYCVIHPKCA